MEDKEIVQLFWERNDMAIEQTERKYQKLLYHIAGNIAPSAEDAEECVNDTYMKIWHTIPPEKPASLRNYAACLVRNLAIDVYRKKQTEYKYCEAGCLCDELAEVLPDGINEYEYIEWKDLLNRFLEGLDADNRILFVKRYWQTESIAELAKFYGIKESTVKMRLSRMRKKLKVYLEKEGIFA